MHYFGGKNMSRHKAKRMRDMMRKAMKRDPQHYQTLHAYPGSGMSGANLYWLWRFIEKGEERE